jgi:hypothetical protein
MNRIFYGAILALLSLHVDRLKGKVPETRLPCCTTTISAQSAKSSLAQKSTTTPTTKKPAKQGFGGGKTAGAGGPGLHTNEDDDGGELAFAGGPLSPLPYYEDPMWPDGRVYPRRQRDTDGVEFGDMNFEDK